MLRTKTGRTAFLVMFLVAVAGVSGVAHAQTPRCDDLWALQKQVAHEIFAAMHPYDGCDATFEQCLARKPPHPTVLRLADDICRQVRDGRSQSDIERALAKRAQSILPTSKSSILTIDENTLAGDPEAPVCVVIYACARCPFCRVFVTALHKEVTQGSLKGKVRLYFRPFPLKGHPGSTEAGLAMLSASRLKKFWPFVLTVYDRFDTFDTKLLPEWAAEVGMDQATFEKLMADPATRKALVAAKQEGLRNEVEATPTLFIGGRRYVYDVSLEVVIDVLHEAYEGPGPSRSYRGNTGSSDATKK
jgi:protein-disulfide isomerase